MSTIDYPPPVDKLLTYGRPEPRSAQDWPDYLELGLGPEHIPDLLRMTANEELWEAGEDASENWAPVHAWRALGQLRAVNAVEPLLHLLVERVRDDWAMDELPQVYGLIGAAAIPTHAISLPGFLARVKLKTRKLSSHGRKIKSGGNQLLFLNV